MNGIYLLLGSNLGDRLEMLQNAINHLKAHPIKIIRRSTIYESAPWGIIDQPWFLNVVIQIESGLPPFQLLKVCLEVEKKIGRERKVKWGERTIDVDILYYKDITQNDKQLTIPHPEIQNRMFTLMPMVEIAREQLHPISNYSQLKLMQDCKDSLACKATNLKLEI
jgi:2-amino-4-hydroxy-6-hydroxymethyldihydropteridine diphosphokinase